MMLDQIICPICLGSFRTIYQEKKQERCPYCGQIMEHSARLLDLARKVQQEGNTPAAFHQWVQANLELIGIWWHEQGQPDARNIDVLAGKLEELVRAARELRRRM